MALLPTRPAVRVLLGHSLVAGETATVVVELACARAASISRVVVRLVGEVSWTYSGHYRGHRQTARFLRGEHTLVDAPRRLDAGTHRLHARFTLPDDLPGSWEGNCLAIEYRVIVDVAIPWWIGVHREYAVSVTPLPREPTLAHSRVWASHAAGPSGTQPYVEIALASTSLRAGGELRGSAALGNVAWHRYRRLVVQLVARETLPRIIQLAPIEERVICGWTIQLDRIEELAPLPFTLRLPERLVPGFDVHDCQLRWLLIVFADARGSAGEVRMPVDVAPATSRALANSSEAPLAVGSERMRLIWASAAQHSGLELVEGRLLGELGVGPNAVTLEIRRGLGPRGEPRLHGELRMASLGVGLATKLERRGVNLRAREPRVSAIIAHEIGGLERLEQLGLREADDTKLVFERDDAGLRLDALLDLVVALRELAERVATLPAHLPAPRGMAAHVGAWEAAASALGGRLRRADMRIEIVREPLRLTIGCLFAHTGADARDDDDAGDPSGTLLELHPNLGIPTRLQLAWNGHGPVPEHAWPLAEFVRAPSWRPDRPARLSIGERTIQVLLPAPLPDPRLEADRIELLFAYGRSLHGEHDPYR